MTVRAQDCQRLELTVGERVVHDSTAYQHPDSDRPNVLFVGPNDAGPELLANLESSGYATTQAHSAEAGLRVASAGGVKALIWDMDTPGGSIDLLRGVAARIPTVLVVGEATVPTAVSALRLGLLDYLVKPLAADEVLPALEKATQMMGQRRAVRVARETVSRWIEALDILRDALPDFGDTGDVARARSILEPTGEALPSARPRMGRDRRLSLREREVVQLLSQGRSVSVIARSLSISPHTVRNHLKAIFRKVGVHSQVELVSRAREFLS